MDVSEAKYEKLTDELKGYGRLAVAFSAGVDSTFLLWAEKRMSSVKNTELNT